MYYRPREEKSTRRRGRRGTSRQSRPHLSLLGCPPACPWLLLALTSTCLTSLARLVLQLLNLALNLLLDGLGLILHLCRRGGCGADQTKEKSEERANQHDEGAADLGNEPESRDGVT